MGWPWPRVDPPHAGGRRASCSAGRGVGGWCCRSRHSGLSAGPSAPQGERVSGVSTRLTPLELRGAQGRLGAQIREEKVSNGTDVRRLTPTTRVRDGAGGAAELVVVLGARGWGAWAGLAGTPQAPAARGYSLTWTPARGTHSEMPLSRSRNAFPSSLAPHLDCRKISFKFSLRVSNVHEGI